MTGAMRRGAGLRIGLGASLVMLLQGHAAAQALPHFDVRPGCVSHSVDATREVQTCLQDEARARDQLAKEWSTYAAADRAHCIVSATSGGIQSYIELHVCLQIAKDARTGNLSGEMTTAPPRPRR